MTSALSTLLAGVLQYIGVLFLTLTCSVLITAQWYRDKATVDIHLDDESVSRNHAAIVHHKEGKIYIIDLDTVSGSGLVCTGANSLFCSDRFEAPVDVHAGSRNVREREPIRQKQAH